MDGAVVALGCRAAFVPALLSSSGAGAEELLSLRGADGRATGEDLLWGLALWNTWQVVGPCASAFQVIE